MNYTAMHLANEHARELHRQAGAARLSALARCCQPSAWRAAFGTTVAKLRALHSGGAAACTPCA